MSHCGDKRPEDNNNNYCYRFYFANCYDNANEFPTRRRWEEEWKSAVCCSYFC